MGSSSGEGFLRQLSTGGERGKGSRRWGTGGGRAAAKKKMEEETSRNRNRMVVAAAKKRVIVVMDGSGRAKHAMMWALTHVANKGDLLTLLHVVPHNANANANANGGGDEHHHHLGTSLGSFCKSCNPHVEVEALVIEGPKLATVLSQVRKLEASVLVLSQPNPSHFCCMLKSSSEDFVEQCINRAECLTMAVRKQSRGVGGYLVSTRWQRNFWLLA